MNRPQKIGIYSKLINQNQLEIINNVVKELKKYHCSISFNKEIIDNDLDVKMSDNIEYSVYTNNIDIKSKVDVLLSVGGDGTFLDTLKFVFDNNIPVLGINTGRLGFLAQVTFKEIQYSFANLFENNFEIENRPILEFSSPELILNNSECIALNDITFRRGDNASMLSFLVEIDGQLLNNYWADGIIISTATGSTAYSLSCGGPILSPLTKAILITPIASHTLTLRPLVISDSSIITISVSGRNCNYFVGIDANNYCLSSNKKINIKISKNIIKVININKNSFFDTIREKLFWGYDKRN